MSFLDISGKVRKRALELEKRAFELRAKLDFENAGEYFFQALYEWLYIGDKTRALYVLYECYRNSYAKICKYLLNELWTDIPKMVERNLEGFKRACLDLIVEAREYEVYFNLIAENILKTYRERNFIHLSQLLFDERFLGDLYMPILEAIKDYEKRGYVDIAFLDGIFNFGMLGLVNYINLAIYNGKLKGTLSNKKDKIVFDQYIKKKILELATKI